MLSISYQNQIHSIQICFYRYGTTYTYFIFPKSIIWGEMGNFLSTSLFKYSKEFERVKRVNLSPELNKQR